jgi:hypothetical protein
MLLNWQCSARGLLPGLSWDSEFLRGKLTVRKASATTDILNTGTYVYTLFRAESMYYI